MEATVVWNTTGVYLIIANSGWWRVVVVVLMVVGGGGGEWGQHLPGSSQ